MSDTSPTAPEAGLTPETGPPAVTASPDPAGTVPASSLPGPAAAGQPAPGQPRPARRRRPALLAAAAAVLVAGGLGGALLASALNRILPLPHRPPARPAAASHPAGLASQGAAPADRAQVRICTVPAVTCTAGNLTSMQAGPARIVTAGDGSGVLRDLVWSGWGSPHARARGMLEVDNCTPNCAQGTYTGYRARVSVWGLTPYGHGSRGYADMVVTAPGAPTPVETFTSGLVP